jgi:DNA-binding MarR family transcriptional regulator
VPLSDLAARLDDAVRALHRLHPRTAGLSLTAAGTLARLRDEGPRRLTELAAVEGVSQPTMTTLAARLADQGLLHRDRDPRDGRAVVLSLTPEGAHLLARRRAERADRLAGPLADLSPDDVRAIADALPALTRLAGSLTPEARRSPTPVEVTR